MRIAIPLADGHLARHFGHCEKFAFVDVDPQTKQVASSAEIPAPPHEPGLLPPWLKERGIGLVIAGGMGSRALSLFEEVSIQVLTGAPSKTPAELVRLFLDGRLAAGPNACDH